MYQSRIEKVSEELNSLKNNVKSTINWQALKIEQVISEQILISKEAILNCRSQIENSQTLIELSANCLEDMSVVDKRPSKS